MQKKATFLIKFTYFYLSLENMFWFCNEQFDNVVLLFSNWNHLNKKHPYLFPQFSKLLDQYMTWKN